MSQGFVGANADELERLAGRMRNAVDQLEAMTARLSATPRHVWHGVDAARFFDDLDGSLLPQLRAASAGLSAGADTLRRNADEQRAVSASNGSATGGWPSGSVGVRNGDGSNPPASERDATWESVLTDSLGVAKDVLRGGEAFAQAAAADGKDIRFWGFDPNNVSPILGKAFDVGGYGLDSINLLTHVQAAAQGDFGAMATVLDSGGGLIGRLENVTAAGAAAPWAKGIGGVLTVGSDGFRIAEALEDGKAWSATYHGVHAGVAAVGIAVPPVGLGLAAWDTGVSIGTAIGNSSAANSFYDMIVAEGQTQAGGTDVSARYEGFAGGANMARDGAVAAGRKFLQFFGGN